MCPVLISAVLHGPSSGVCWKGNYNSSWLVTRMPTEQAKRTLRTVQRPWLGRIGRPWEERQGWVIWNGNGTLLHEEWGIELVTYNRRASCIKYMNFNAGHIMVVTWNVKPTIHRSSLANSGGSVAIVSIIIILTRMTILLNSVLEETEKRRGIRLIQCFQINIKYSLLTQTLLLERHKDRRHQVRPMPIHVQLSQVALIEKH